MPDLHGSDLTGSDIPEIRIIQPDWPAPANVRAFTTTRIGGFSRGPWDSLNLGVNCGDDPQHVTQNRRSLLKLLPVEPLWLRQVHGKHVVKFSDLTVAAPEADAIVGTKTGQVCVIVHADCLPVLFCDTAGTQVAAVHAGWRGLVAGVLEATVAAMNCDPGQIMAWLGPAIGPRVFEVGRDVYDEFISMDAASTIAFKRHGDTWLADLYKLARFELSKAGIEQVSGGQHCTYTEKDKFFSYRRDEPTGRMATMIWLVE